MKFSNSEQLVVDLFADDYGFYDRYTPLALKTKELFQISVGRCLVKEMRGDLSVNTIGIRNSMGRFMGKFNSAEGLDKGELRLALAYYRHFTLIYRGEIQNVVNLLYYSINNNQEWLNNVDKYGRPKKILKTSSIEALSNEAVKYMSRPAYSFYQDATIVHPTKPEPELEPLSEIDEETFAGLGLDHTLVKLLTPLALKHEGKEMKNCVGERKYDHFLGSKDDLLLSIRYKNTRLATMHVTQSRYGWRIKEFFGKKNGDPDNYLNDLIAPQNWLTSEEYDNLIHQEFNHKILQEDNGFDESLVNRDFGV